jgi:hypothetical protein
VLAIGAVGGMLLTIYLKWIDTILGYSHTFVQYLNLRKSGLTWRLVLLVLVHHNSGDIWGLSGQMSQDWTLIVHRSMKQCFIFCSSGTKDQNCSSGVCMQPRCS